MQNYSKDIFLTKNLILIFIGGGTGSMTRYLIGRYLNKPENLIPYSTLTVNLLGSLIIGLILGIALKNNGSHENLTLALATGFCGGFTTFSAFAFENYIFLKSGDYLSFIIYSLLSLSLGVLAVFAGVYIARTI